MKTFYGNKYKDQCSIDLAQIDLTPRPRQSVLPRIALALVIALIALPALAIPGSTQNPDGSWTGPNGEDLGGGNPPAPEPPAPEPPAPEPTPDRPQSHEGGMTRINCGCGYMVILRDGQTRTQGLAACRATVQAQRCSWVDGVYPGDKG